MKRAINPKSILKQSKEYPVDDAFLASFRTDLAQYVKMNPPLPGVDAPLDKKIPAFGFGFSLKFTVVPITLLLLVFSGTVFASLGSLPGNPLYPVKLAAENVRLAATFSPERKAALRMDFAKERVSEIQKVLSIGAPSSTGDNLSALNQAIVNLNTNLNQVSNYAQGLKQGGDLPKALEVNENLRASVDLYKNVLEKQSAADNSSSSAIVSQISKLQAKVNQEISDIHQKEDEDANKQNFKEATKERLNEADQRFDSIQNGSVLGVPSSSSAGGNEVNKEIEKRINKAKDLLDKAKEDFNKSQFKDSLEKARQSMDASSDAKALIQTAPDVQFQKSDFNDNSGSQNSVQVPSVRSAGPSGSESSVSGGQNNENNSQQSNDSNKSGNDNRDKSGDSDKDKEDH